MSCWYLKQLFSIFWLCALLGFPALAQPAKLALFTKPILGDNDSAFTVQPIIHILDNSDELASELSVEVTAEITSGLGGELLGDTTIFSEKGVAEFDLRLQGIVGEIYEISFSSGSLPIVTAQNLRLYFPGKAAQLSFVTAPVLGKNGEAFATQPVIEVQDVKGNKVVTFKGKVSAAIASGENAELLGQTTVNVKRGIANFNLGFRGEEQQTYVFSFSGNALRPAISKGHKLAIKRQVTLSHNKQSRSSTPYFASNKKNNGTKFDALVSDQHAISDGALSASITLRDSQGLPLTTNVEIAKVAVYVISGSGVLSGRHSAQNSLKVPNKSFSQNISLTSAEKSTYYFDIYPDEVGQTVIGARVTMVNGKSYELKDKLKIHFTRAPNNAGQLRILVPPKLGANGLILQQPQIALYDKDGLLDNDANVGKVKAYILGGQAELYNQDGSDPSTLVASGLANFNQLYLEAKDRQEVIFGFIAEGYIPVLTEKLQILSAADLLKNRVESTLVAELRETLEYQKDRFNDVTEDGIKKLRAYKPADPNRLKCDRNLLLNIIDRASPSEQPDEAGVIEGNFSKGITDCDKRNRISIDGRYSITSQTNMKIRSYEADLNMYSEDIVNDKFFQGIMFGIYSKRSDVENADSTGKVVGNGLHAAYYGAYLIGEQALSYYLGSSMGNHSYQLDFALANIGEIETNGDYQYLALLLGSALAREVNLVNFLNLTPRVGFDASYAATSMVDLYARYFARQDSFEFNLADYFNGSFFVEIDIYKEFILKDIGLHGFKFTPNFNCEKEEIFSLQIDENSFCGEEYNLNYYFRSGGWIFTTDYQIDRDYQSRRDEFSIKLQREIKKGIVSLGGEVFDDNSPSVLLEYNYNF